MASRSTKLWSLVVVRPLLGYPVRSLAAVALFATVSCFASIGVVVRATIDRSAAAAGETVVGHADVVVRALGPGGIDGAVAERVARTPGVEVAGELFATYLSVDHRDVLLLGVSAPAGQLVGVGGTVPSSGVLLSPALADRLDMSAHPSKPVPAAIDGRTVVLPVAGALGGPVTPSVGDAEVIVAPLALVRSWVDRPGRVTHVLVRAQPGEVPAELRARLEAQVPDSAVMIAGREAESAGVALSALGQLNPLVTAVLLALAAAAAFILLGNLALAQRGTFGVIRSLGVPRSRAALLFAAQAMALACAGAAGGVVAGAHLGGEVMETLPTPTTSSLVTGVRLARPWPVLAATGVLTVLGAGAVAALARRSVTIARGEAPAARRRHWRTDAGAPAVLVAVAVAGAGAMAAGVVGVALRPVSDVAAATAVLALGGLALSFALRERVVAATLGALGRFGVVGLLTVDAVAGAPRRFWSMACVLGGTLAVSVALIAGAANTTASAREALLPQRDIDVIVQGTDPALVPVSPILPDSVTERVGRLPGVRAVRGSQYLFSIVARRQVLVQGVEAGSGSPMAVLGRRLSGRDVGRGEAVLSTQVAERLGVAAGARIELPTPRGRRQVRVNAVVPTVLWRAGVVVLHIEDQRAWYERPGSTMIEVELTDATRREAVRDAIASWADTEPVRVQAVTGAEALVRSTASVERAARILSRVGAAALVAGGLAVLSALALSVAERRAELGIVRALGATRRALAGAVVLEGVAAFAVALVQGLPLGLVLQLACARLQGGPEGFPVEFAPVPGAAGAAVVASLVVVLLGCLPPAGAAASVRAPVALAFE